MTSERPICNQAMAGLKRNSTKLLITMCVGIALAMYGIYVQARTQSNPGYMPTISMATHWLYKSIGKEAVKNPTKMLTNCFTKQVVKHSARHTLLKYMILPVVHFSGVFNGLINTTQIILLKVYCRDQMATNVIIGMSILGFVISMVCLFGSYFTCKLMCISCLGIQHCVIVWLAMRRKRILYNMLCPPANTNEGACTFGSTGGTTGRVFGAVEQKLGPLRKRSVK